MKYHACPRLSLFHRKHAASCIAGFQNNFWPRSLFARYTQELLAILLYATEFDIADFYADSDRSLDARQIGAIMASYKKALLCGNEFSHFTMISSIRLSAAFHYAPMIISVATQKCSNFA